MDVSTGEHGCHDVSFHPLPSYCLGPGALRPPIHCGSGGPPMSRRPHVLACLVISSLLTLATAAPALAAGRWSTTDYIALGDSYASGLGASGASGTCSVSSNGYPGLWATANSPQSFSNAA